jgi:hypothetical protein
MRRQGVMSSDSAGTTSIPWKATRRFINGEWHSVHVSPDGGFTVDTGPDDQRPDADGMEFFRPICVAEIPHWMDSVWNYHKYCGACRKYIGSLGEVREYCSRCGKGIAHYVFAMGVVPMKRGAAFTDQMPDVLPDHFRNGSLEEPVGGLRGGLETPGEPVPGTRDTTSSPSHG